MDRRLIVERGPLPLAVVSGGTDRIVNLRSGRQTFHKTTSGDSRQTFTCAVSNLDQAASGFWRGFSADAIELLL